MVSILDAGKARLRPILLTSVTTVAGLWALAFYSTGAGKISGSDGAGVDLGYDVRAADHLVLIPCLYAIVYDVVLRRHRRHSQAVVPAIASSATAKNTSTQTVPTR